MNIFVKVKPKAHEEKVIKIDSNHYLVYINVAPEKGKANEAVIKCISNYFNVPKSQVNIISGATSRQKQVSILSY